MAGLLDMFQNMSPEQSQGLMAAAAQMLEASGPSRTPVGLGQVLGRGVMAYQGSMADQQARQQQTQLRDLQIRGAEAELAAQQRALEKQQRVSDVFRDSYMSPGAQAASLPGGPTADNAARVGEFQGRFDADSAIGKLWAIDPAIALQMQQSMKKAATEFDTKPQTATDDMGNVFQYLVGKDGTIRKLDGMKPRDEMKLAGLGDREVAYNPFGLQAGQTFQRGVSPDTRSNNAVTMRGQDMTDSRARDANDLTRQGQRTQIVTDPVQGPMLIDKGTGQARQVMMNGQPIPGENEAKKAAAGRNLMPLIKQAETLIDGATGSYWGTAIDHGARLFGAATGGAESIAQLRVLEGNLMMAQPRMEGPQSNLDVELYRQMAAQIGDPTVPNSTKKAALKTVRRLYEKYEPASGQSSGSPGGVKFLGFE